MVKNEFDELFYKKEKKIKKVMDARLLAKLLLLNYEFLNNEYHGTTATEVFNNMHKVKYTQKDIDEIIRNAITYLNIESSMKVIDYEKLNFDTIN